MTKVIIIAKIPNTKTALLIIGIKESTMPIIPKTKLAVDVGLSYDFIRRLEYKKGAIGCSIDTLYKISVVLGITMDKFFE